MRSYVEHFRAKLAKMAALAVVVTLVFSLGPAEPARSGTVPKFRDYPVASIYHGPVAKPDFKADPAARTFRTRIRDAARNGRVNFAGHFILTTWGCGTTCIHGAVIDAISGAAYLLPYTICCHRAFHLGFSPIELRPSSRLIVFAGLLNEEGEMGAHFFEFRDGEFRHLLTVPNDGTFQ